MDSGKVLIVGHRGQDGSLLRESLAAQKRRVIGLGRRVLEHYDEQGRCISSIDGPTRVEEVVEEEMPTEVYYLAAEHSSSEGDLSTALSPPSFSRYVDSNVVGFLRTLDAVRLHSPESRVFFASSSHVFGPGGVRSLTEKSRLNPKTYYAMTKVQGMWISEKFRREAGLHISCGILFNHESHLRDQSFVSAKIIRGALQIKGGSISEFQVGNLDARVDWGYARDFVEAFQAVVRRETPDDYVIATGETHTVREFLSSVFELLDLDWKDHVREERSLIRNRHNIERANPARIFETTGWRPQYGFEDFVKRLVADHRSHHGVG